MTLEIKHGIWVAAFAVVLAMTLPGIAFAQDTEKAETETTEETSEDATKETESPPEVASVLSTLPVLGSGLDVTITRDDEGDIESVSLDPSEGTTIVKEGEHRVVFLLGDGDTEVIVKSVEGFVQTKVKADSTADATGDGAWSGDVFGTGDVTVPYTVAFDGNTPMITVGAISAPPDVTAVVGEPKVKTSDDGDRAFTAVKVEFTSGEQDAVLALVAKVKVKDDGETRVVVSASLLSGNRVKCGFGEWRGGDSWDRKDGDRESDRQFDRDARWKDRNRDDRDWDRDEWDSDDKEPDWDRDESSSDEEKTDRDGDRDHDDRSDDDEGQDGDGG